MKRRPGPIWQGSKPGKKKPLRETRERFETLYGLPSRDALTARQKWAVAGVAVAGVLFLLSITLFNLRPPPRQVRLIVTGTPGLRVKGILGVDGHSHDFEAHVPTNCLISAHDLDFSVKRAGGGAAGELIVVVFLDGKQRSFVTSTTPTGGVSVEIRHGLFKDRYKSATFEVGK
ncbi:MAG: hypothetical protein HY300_00805 [Verrucomicrobia bacterium]|nr:hypothetical protein [Verrucomicrobiota bacterium]